MNMNVSKTNTGKLLAAVLVMAMVIAGAAVVFSNESVDAADNDKVAADGTTTVGLVHDSAGLIVTKDGTNGYKFSAETTTNAAGGTIFDNNNSLTSDWSYIVLNLSGVFSGDVTTVTIKQTNNALRYAYADPASNIQGNVKTQGGYTSSSMNDDSVSGGYAFLVPSDGSRVTIEITDETTNKLVGKYTFDFSGVTEIKATVTDENALKEAFIGATYVDATGVSSITEDFTVPEGKTLELGNSTEIAQGKTLTVEGALVGNVTKGNVNAVDGADLTGADLSGATVYFNGNSQVLTLYGDLDKDLSAVNVRLGQSLTIPAGLTLSVDGTLDLAGQTLVVNGTLEIGSNGTIVNTGADGQITLAKGGVISNNGVIGNGSDVKIAGADDVDEKYTAGGSVTVNNVKGLSIELVRNGTSGQAADAKPNYTIAVSGNLTKASDNNSIEFDGVLIGGDMTIADKVNATFSGNASIVQKGVTLTVRGTATAGEYLTMAAGSTVVITGTIDQVNAQTGDYKTSEGYSSLTENNTTAVTLAGAKGVTLTVGSVSYNEQKDGDDKAYSYTSQRLYVSGTVSETVSKVDGSMSVYGNAAYVASNVTFTVGKYIDVDGDFIVEGAIKGDDLSGINYTGAMYSTTDADDNVTYTITNFEAAFGAIDSADDKTITLGGEIEIDASLTVAAGQTIDIGDAVVSIGTDAVVTVEAEGTIDGKVDNVDGKLVQKDGASVEEPVTYQVYSKTDAETVYAGLAAALKDAQGEVTVTQSSEIKGSLTIPEGATLIIEDCTLTVEKDVIVNGKLVVDGGELKMTAGNKLTVNGEADGTEGTLPSNAKITSTGTTVVPAAFDMTNVNGAVYTDDDNNKVITTFAKAVAALDAMDIINKSVDLCGEFTESGEVTVNGMTVNVTEGAKVTLGNVTLAGTDTADAQIVVDADGTLTAAVSGQSGTDGSTVVSSIDATEVSDITFVNACDPNSENVMVWTTTVQPTTETTYALKGDIEVTAGTITAAAMQVSGDNTVTVASGATLVIPGSIEVDVVKGAENADKAGLTVNGTVTVNGTLDIDGIVTVSGTMTVAKTASVDAASVDVAATTGILNILGTLNVVADDDNGDGNVTVNGVLAVGDKPSTIGAAGEVTGVVATAGNGYVKVYSGGSVANAVIDDDGNGMSTAKSTAFYINNDVYMTVYSKTAVTIDDAFLTNEKFSLTGYVTTGINDLTEWYTDANMTQPATAAKIGDPEALYFKANADTVTVEISVGSGISLYIDGIKYSTKTDLRVGEHTVTATVNPGYTGDVTISFNGPTVTDGKFTITPEMASQAYDGVISVSAIMVALRLMRS